MSNRFLTFSLASLILIFAFAVMPAMAHDGHTDAHPTVSITAAPDSAYSTTDMKARDNFKVRIAFSVGGSTDASRFTADLLESGDITFAGFDRSGNVVTGTAAAVAGTATFNDGTATDTRVAANKMEWIVPIDISGATVRTLEVTVGTETSAVVTGAHRLSRQASEPKTASFSDLPIVSDRTVDVTVAPVAATPVTNDYLITFKFSGTTAVDDFDTAQLVVTPESFRGTLAAPVGDGSNPNVYTLAVNLSFDVQTVTIGVDPAFAKATTGKASSVRVPPITPPPAPTQLDPTVSITVDDLDTAARTFRVDVTSTPGAMSDNSTPKAQPVTHANLEVKDAGGMVIMTTIEEEDTATDSTTNVSRYVAVLQYGLASTVPATVGLKATFKTANTVTPVVIDGGSGDTNSAPMFDATAPISISGTVGTAIDAADASATDADNDTLTYSWDVTDEAALGLMLNTSTGMITGTPLKAHTMEHTVTVTDGTDSAMLTVNVAITAASGGNGQDDPTVLAFDGDIGENNTLTLTAGTAIGSAGMQYIQLPQGRGGDTPYTYALIEPDGRDITPEGRTTGPIGNGLSLDMSTRRLVGTPTAADTGSMYTWRVTDAADTQVDIEFTIVVNAQQEQPPGPAVATLDGTASLTGPFRVVITFDKATTLMEEDIVVTPEGAGYVDSNSLRPASGSASVFTVTINPIASATTITVTIKTNTRIKPHATNGSITDSAPVATLTSITGPANFDGTAPFLVELTFEEARVSVESADLSVTGGSVTEIGHKVGFDAKVVQVEITPTGTMDVVVGLSTAGMGKFTYSGTAKTVPRRVAPPIPGDITATYDALTRETSISEGAIAANGFVVIGASALPDLEEFFDIGGTIGLHDPDAADGNDKNSREVVMSEILWGLDFGATAIADQKQWQFIELYNTTNATIDLAGWMLKFTEGRPVPKSDVDQVSNRAGTGFVVDIGQSGRVTNTRATDATATITAINIVSMYRNINYDKVEKVKADGTADPSREEQLKGIPGGNGKGSWKASTRRDPATPAGVGISGAEAARWVYSSRGREHYTTTAILTATAIARTPFIINEIGNGSGDTNDWVELRNVTSSEQSLNNYHLSFSKEKDHDASLVNFKDKDVKVPANGVILIVNKDPSETDLAGGINAQPGLTVDDQEKKGATHRYYVDANLKLDDGGKFNLILRNAHDKLKASSHFMDIVAVVKIVDDTKGTSLWPLVATGAPNGNVIDGADEAFKAPLVYQRGDAAGGFGEKDLAKRGYTGIGYDRTASKSDANGGTPGYDNGALKEKVADLTAAEITISEVMVDTGSARSNLPQWIELYNSSMTQAVNLNGWKLMIENAADEEVSTFNATLTLKAMTISPNQTVLIASTSGRTSDADHFPSTRVLNLWTTKDHRQALEMTRRTDQVLSVNGFHLKLTDKDNKVVDMVGNLDGNRRTRDEPTWAIPMSKEEGRRSSLIRRYDDGIAVDGEISEGWVLASNTDLAFVISHTFYGDADDFGTPGYRGGGPLPVSLSKFRPERMKDTGEIVVRWVTESELNNAGFNILRSEKRDGEFTKVHFRAGQGTTSERTAYEWKDTSAKPNVVYYYQIQDVSLDGKVTTLRVTHLRGNVTATGKATTTWGEIKALRE